MTHDSSIYTRAHDTRAEDYGDAVDCAIACLLGAINAAGGYRRYFSPEREEPLHLVRAAAEESLRTRDHEIVVVTHFSQRPRPGPRLHRDVDVLVHVLAKSGRRWSIARRLSQDISIRRNIRYVTRSLSM